MGKKRTFNDNSDSEEVVSKEKLTSSTSNELSDISEPTAKKIKQLPPGYTCKICGVVDHHAVYDCPQKVKKFGKVETATEPKPLKHVTSTLPNTDDASGSSMSVFISGLPYDINRDALLKFLISEGCEEELQKKHIKLVMFEDNSKKCKGLAYVKFHTEEQIAKCVAINGKKFGPLNLSIERVESNRPKASKVTHKAIVHGANSKRCYRCGMLHDSITCTNPRVCYKCKSTEHLSKDCPMKKKAN